MCIAILKKPNGVLDYDTLRQCHTSNKDGCGLAYVDSAGNMTIHKTMNFEEFWKTYQECLADNPQSIFMIHFRISTCGTVDEFNCHPFFVDKHRAMMHNGMISECRPTAADKRNDTQVFNDEILKALPWTAMKHPSIGRLIGKFIDHSKVIILNDKQEFIIYNEDKGHWNEDKSIWFSNYSYRIYKTTTTKQTYTDDFSAEDYYARYYYGRGGNTKDKEKPKYYWADFKFIENIGGKSYFFDYSLDKPRWVERVLALAPVQEQPHFPKEGRDATIRRRAMPVTSEVTAFYKCFVCDMAVCDSTSSIVSVDKEVVDFDTLGNKAILCKECAHTIQTNAAKKGHFMTVHLGEGRNAAHC